MNVIETTDAEPTTDAELREHLREDFNDYIHEELEELRDYIGLEGTRYLVSRLLFEGAGSALYRVLEKLERIEKNAKAHFAAEAMMLKTA